MLPLYIIAITLFPFFFYSLIKYQIEKIYCICSTNSILQIKISPDKAVEAVDGLVKEVALVEMKMVVMDCPQTELTLRNILKWFLHLMSKKEHKKQGKISKLLQFTHMEHRLWQMLLRHIWWLITNIVGHLQMSLMRKWQHGRWSWLLG